MNCARTVLMSCRWVAKRVPVANHLISSCQGRIAASVHCPHWGSALPRAEVTLGDFSFPSNLRARWFGSDIATGQARTCEMAAITTIGSIANGPRISSEEAIRTPFAEHNQELTWLAEFLTGDETVASACVMDASTLTEGENGKDQEWLWPWPREATICSALDVQRVRIAQLSSVYDRCDCVYGEHAALPVEML